MNFEIFDEDFKTDKPQYVKEIETLEKTSIEKEYIKEWKDFVKAHLTDTRNFYLLKTALKVIKNLQDKKDYDTAVFSALSFMPDQTFVETTIMLVTRFSNFGEGLALHFNLDVSEIVKAKKEKKLASKKTLKQDDEGKEKIKTQTNAAKDEKNLNELKKENSLKEEVYFGKILPEKKLISKRGGKLIPVEKHLKNISTKKSKK